MQLFKEEERLASSAIQKQTKSWKTKENICFHAGIALTAVWRRIGWRRQTQRMVKDSSFFFFFFGLKPNTSSFISASRLNQVGVCVYVSELISALLKWSVYVFLCVCAVKYLPEQLLHMWRDVARPPDLQVTRAAPGVWHLGAEWGSSVSRSSTQEVRIPCLQTTPRSGG